LPNALQQLTLPIDMNALLKRVGIEHPIIQAPMASVSTPEMAAAVSNAGGLGSIGVGNLSAADARKMIESVRQLSGRPFNVNVFCHRPATPNATKEARWIEFLSPQFEQFGAAAPRHLGEIYKSFLVDKEMLGVLLETRPAVVSFHFGLPTSETIESLRQAGIILIASATNLAEGRAIQSAGLDAIVAQGYEAGGHRGVFDPALADERLSMSALTSALVNELPLPIIAAGGIMDGKDISQALRIGASAAQLGTAFVLCQESSADAGHKALLRGRGDKHTVMTSIISGRLGRALETRFTALAATCDLNSLPDYPIAYDAAKALHAAGRSKNEFGYGAYWAGQGAARCRELPVSELMQALIREYQQ
jgi:nitronate monooxygenase